MQEQARHPSGELSRKIEKTATRLVAAYASKAATAMAQGKALTAGTHWHDAFVLCAPGIAEETCEDIRAAVVENRTALESAADEASRKRKWEPATAVYELLQSIAPGDPIAGKQLAARKGLAASLQDRADALAPRLPGAAWAMNVRALEHDPMHPTAYRERTAIERAMRSRAKVDLDGIAIDAKRSDRAFADKVAKTIRPRIDDVKPYGPTKEATVVRATLTMKIVRVDRRDVSASGVETRKSGKQEWKLPYRDVTRSVEATVRFTLEESDVAEPVVLELTRHIARTDRTHGGSSKRKVKADPLKLPSSDALLAELAPRFAEGAAVIASARDRRVHKHLVAAKKQLARGRTDDALHAYVQALFLAGPEALPADAAAFVARAIERDELETLVASVN